MATDVLSLGHWHLQRISIRAAHIRHYLGVQGDGHQNVLATCRFVAAVMPPTRLTLSLHGARLLPNASAARPEHNLDSLSAVTTAVTIAATPCTRPTLRLRQGWSAGALMIGY